MDYISDNGQVNGEMFCTITRCIVNGKCSHVDGAPNNHMTEIKIYGMQLAAAVGTTEAVKGKHIQIQKGGPTGFYGITPCHIGFLKCETDMLELLWNIYPQLPFKQFVLHSSRDLKDYNRVMFHLIPLVEPCVRKNDAKLFGAFLKAHHKVLGIAYALK